MNGWVTVASFSNVNLARVALLRLEMSGVEALVLDAELVAADPLLGRAVGLVKVQVRAEDVERALRALDRAGPGTG